jgi:hypothetical protein
MDELLRQLAASGPIGIIAAIAIFIAWKKDQQLKALYERTLEKLEADRDRNYRTLKELNQTVGALAEYEANGQEDTDVE